MKKRKVEKNGERFGEREESHENEDRGQGNDCEGMHKKEGISKSIEQGLKEEMTGKNNSMKVVSDVVEENHIKCESENCKGDIKCTKEENNLEHERQTNINEDGSRKESNTHDKEENNLEHESQTNIKGEENKEHEKDTIKKQKEENSSLEGKLEKENETIKETIGTVKEEINTENVLKEDGNNKKQEKEDGNTKKQEKEDQQLKKQKEDFTSAFKHEKLDFTSLTNNAFDQKNKKEEKQRESSFLKTISILEKKEESNEIKFEGEKLNKKGILYKFKELKWNKIGKGSAIISKYEEKMRLTFVREKIGINAFDNLITYDLNCEVFGENCVRFGILMEDKTEVFCVKFFDKASCESFCGLVRDFK